MGRGTDGRAEPARTPARLVGPARPDQRRPRRRARPAGDRGRNGRGLLWQRGGRHRRRRGEPRRADGQRALGRALGTGMRTGPRIGTGTGTRTATRTAPRTGPRAPTTAATRPSTAAVPTSATSEPPTPTEAPTTGPGSATALPTTSSATPAPTTPPPGAPPPATPRPATPPPASAPPTAPAGRSRRQTASRVGDTATDHASRTEAHGRSARCPHAEACSLDPKTADPVDTPPSTRTTPAHPDTPSTAEKSASEPRRPRGGAPENHVERAGRRGVAGHGTPHPTARTRTHSTTAS